MTREQQEKEIREHRGYPSSTYRTWASMKQRCLNKNDKSYPRYGGRGISVCERWLSFELFLEDMGERPTDMTLERVNNGKGYAKENCKWATIIEQNNNRRDSRLLRYKGVTKTATQWRGSLKLTERH